MGSFCHAQTWKFPAGFRHGAHGRPVNRKSSMWSQFFPAVEAGWDGGPLVEASGDLRGGETTLTLSHWPID